MVGETPHVPERRSGKEGAWSQGPTRTRGPDEGGPARSQCSPRPAPSTPSGGGRKAAARCTLSPAAPHRVGRAEVVVAVSTRCPCPLPLPERRLTCPCVCGAPAGLAAPASLGHRQLRGARGWGRGGDLPRSPHSPSRPRGARGQRPHGQVLPGLPGRCVLKHMIISCTRLRKHGLCLLHLFAINIPTVSPSGRCGRPRGRGPGARGSALLRSFQHPARSRLGAVYCPQVSRWRVRRPCYRGDSWRS